MESFKLGTHYTRILQGCLLSFRMAFALAILVLSSSNNFAQQSDRLTGPSVKNRDRFKAHQVSHFQRRLYFPKGPKYKNRKRWRKVYDMAYTRAPVYEPYKRITGVKAKNMAKSQRTLPPIDSLGFSKSRITPYGRDTLVEYKSKD